MTLDRGFGGEKGAKSKVMKRCISESLHEDE